MRQTQDKLLYSQWRDGRDSVRMYRSAAEIVLHNREELRKDLEALRVLALDAGAADFMKSVSHLAELRTGRTVEEILRQLNDAQVMSLRRALDQAIHLMWLVMRTVCAATEAVAYKSAGTRAAPECAARSGAFCSGAGVPAVLWEERERHLKRRARLLASLGKNVRLKSREGAWKVHGAGV